MKRIGASIFVALLILVAVICGIQSASAGPQYCSAACPVAGCDYTIYCICDWNPLLVTDCDNWLCNDQWCPV
jgi:hypothetical protein